jgi:hypothetical protein
MGQPVSTQRGFSLWEDISMLFSVAARPFLASGLLSLAMAASKASLTSGESWVAPLFMVSNNAFSYVSVVIISFSLTDYMIFHIGFSAARRKRNAIVCRLQLLAYAMFLLLG